MVCVQTKKKNSTNKDNKNKELKGKSLRGDKHAYGIDGGDGFIAVSLTLNSLSCIR